MEPLIDFQKIPEQKKIIITHRYPHTAETVYDAFTKTEYLEKWWAPEPYKAVIVRNNFADGEQMFYYMLSPEGEKHYCLVRFQNIRRPHAYEAFDAFCDENEVINTDLPQIRWINTFEYEDGQTTVVNTLHFENSDDLENILKMGFEEGYRTCLQQLNRLLNDMN